MRDMSFQGMYSKKYTASPKKYTEIFKLKEMLGKAKIPFEWRDNSFTNFISYQICVPGYNREERIISIIEGDDSYGREEDLLEIMGLLTFEERENDSVVGYLTAKNVFGRIKKAWEKINEVN